MRGVLGVALHGGRHVARFEADDDLLVTESLAHLDVPQCALDHRLGARKAVLVDQVLFQAARVDPDPHRNPFVACLADDLLESLVTADIAGVDPDLVDGGLSRRRDGVETGESHAVVIVDIGDQGDLDPVADELDRLDILLLGDRDADDLAARLFQTVNLGQGCVDVERIRRRHRLHPDGLIAADNVVAQTDFARLVPWDRRRVGHRSSSWYCGDQPIARVPLASNA